MNRHFPPFMKNQLGTLLAVFIGYSAYSKEATAPAAGGLEAFKKEIGAEELQKLQGRLDALNRDITEKGMLTVPGQTEPLLTGYAYGQFYDWDLYFENLYLSYYGISDFCFSNFKAFMGRQQPDGFIPRLLWPERFRERPAIQAVPSPTCCARLAAARKRLRVAKGFLL